jgi:hypothetical protein
MGCTPAPNASSPPPPMSTDATAAAAAGRVALGASASQLLANLGASYARLLGPKDEVVVQEACHESNIGPWVRAAGEGMKPGVWSARGWTRRARARPLCKTHNCIAARLQRRGASKAWATRCSLPAYPFLTLPAASGATLKLWRVDTTPAFAAAPAPSAAAVAADGGPAGGGDGALRASFPCACPLSKLAALLSPRTRLVAATHVSNLLGGVQDLPRLVALVRAAAPRCLCSGGVQEGCCPRARVGGKPPVLRRPLCLLQASRP